MNETGEITKMENIKNLYSQVTDKGKVLETLAKEFKVKVTTIKTNWLSSSSVPDGNQDKVIEIMQNAIALENENKSA